MRMTRIALAVAAVSFAACQDTGAPTAPTAVEDAAFSRSDQANQVASDFVFRFDRLFGNNVTGADGRIRDQNAAGGAWRVDRAEARLSRNGKLRVKVEGLVLQSTGVNPLAEFRAILSCQTPDGNSLVNVNLQTETVAVGPDGDAQFREQLRGIPSPCYAPIVFVTSAGGAWLAVSGF
jgi:hypothetical protein